jgi:hypothetical protein
LIDHPFRRVWSRSASDLKVGINYFDRGPHRFEAAMDVLYHAPGELEQFEFHWTVADYITAILASGCQLIHAEEIWRHLRRIRRCTDDRASAHIAAGGSPNRVGDPTGSNS